MTLAHPNPTCADCNDYVERRAEVLPAHIVATAKRRGISTAALATAVIEAVHERHLSGLSLDAP